MLGGDVHAEQALDWGLAHKVVPAADLEAETRAFAERLAGLPRSAGMIKRLLRKTMTLSLPEQLKLEAKLQDEAAQTKDFVEGVTAFMGSGRRRSRARSRQRALLPDSRVGVGGRPARPLPARLPGHRLTWPTSARCWRRAATGSSRPSWGDAPTDLADRYDIRDLAAMPSPCAGRWRETTVPCPDRPRLGRHGGLGCRKASSTVTPPSPSRCPRRCCGLSPGRPRAELRRSWYMGFQQLAGLLPWLSASPPDLPRLWSDWSPGYDVLEQTAPLQRRCADRGAPHRRSRRPPRPPAVAGVPARSTPWISTGAQDGCVLPDNWRRVPSSSRARGPAEKLEWWVRAPPYHLADDGPSAGWVARPVRGRLGGQRPSQLSGAWRSVRRATRFRLRSHWGATPGRRWS